MGIGITFDILKNYPNGNVKLVLNHRLFSPFVKAEAFDRIKHFQIFMNSLSFSKKENSICILIGKSGIYCT